MAVRSRVVERLYSVKKTCRFCRRVSDRRMQVVLMDPYYFGNQPEKYECSDKTPCEARVAGLFTEELALLRNKSSVMCCRKLMSREFDKYNNVSRWICAQCGKMHSENVVRKATRLPLIPIGGRRA